MALHLQLPSLRGVYYALELGWTAQDSIDMPVGSSEAMMNELASLEVGISVHCGSGEDHIAATDSTCH